MFTEYSLFLPFYLQDMIGYIRSSQPKVITSYYLSLSLSLSRGPQSRFNKSPISLPASFPARKSEAGGTKLASFNFHCILCRYVACNVFKPDRRTLEEKVVLGCISALKGIGKRR